MGESNMPKVQKQKPELDIQVIFKTISDAERGIFEVVYKCASCEDTQTLRFMRHEVPFSEVGCSKCRAGLSNNPGGMYPVLGDEALAN